MVFLFIAFLVTILIFTTPINVGFNLFSTDNGKNLHFCYKILNSIKYPAQRKDNKKSKKGKLPISIKLQDKANFHYIKNFIPEKILLEIRLPTCINLAIAYPILGVITGYMTYFDSKNFRLSVVPGDKLYLQGRIELKLNLFMIFSAFFQIIKIEPKRR